MKLAALCPTFGRPRLAANALACFLAQDYPAQERRMFILDDAGQIPTQAHETWEVISVPTRYPSLTEKFNQLARVALDWGADGLVVWEDDDIYLPWHLQCYALELKPGGWCHPKEVWSLYTGQLMREGAAGRFHASLALSKEIYQKIGGWPDTKRGDFDQQLIARLTQERTPGRPDNWDEPSYVYRWGSTHADHGSARMKSAADETWYAGTPITEPGAASAFAAKMDEETKQVYESLIHGGVQHVSAIEVGV
jgi:hypothetical protein